MSKLMGLCQEKSSVDHKGRIILPIDVYRYLGEGPISFIPTFVEGEEAFLVRDNDGYSVDEHRRVIVPRDVLNKLGVSTGDKVCFVLEEGYVIAIAKDCSYDKN